MRKNIGYHTRLRADHTVKVSGGSFGGSLDMETINRLVNSSFDVVITNSGHPVLVDRGGREVRLYISVDVDTTDKGIATLKTWRVEQQKLEKEREAKAREEQEELEGLLNGLSHEEIVRRLKGDK